MVQTANQTEYMSVIELYESRNDPKLKREKEVKGGNVKKITDNKS